MVVVPGDYRGIVFTVLSSVKVDTDRIIRQDLAVRDLRREILLRVLVVQLIVEIRIFRLFPGVLHEIPQQRVDLAAHPLDHVAAVIDRHNFAV